MADWNIKPRSARCSACGKVFEPGGSGHSLLELTEDGTFARRDLCPACFSALPPETLQSLPGAWAFTLANTAKSKTREAPLRKETAEHLLRVLLERNAPADRGVCYVLAILLERSRQFIERRISRAPDGRRIRLYEQRGTGDLFPIEDPGLKPQDLPAIQTRVLALLEGKISLLSAVHAHVKRHSWRPCCARPVKRIRRISR